MQRSSLAPSVQLKTPQHFQTIITAIYAVLMVLLPAVAMLVAVRRATDSFSQSLSTATLLLTGFSLAIVCSAVRLLLANSQPQENHRFHRPLATLLPIISALTIGFSLSLPETPLFALAMFWILLIVEEYISITWLLKHYPLQSPLLVSTSNTMVPNSIENEKISIDRIEDNPLSDTFDEEGLPEGVTQHLTRCSSEEYGEVLSGMLRVQFTAGQRAATIHVAFCPPFEELPQVEVHHLQGPDANIKIAQRMHQGVRIELRLTAKYDKPVNVVVEMIATAPSISST